MGAITTGTIRIYKTAGTNLQEKRLVVGPVTLAELAFLFDSASGYRFRIENGFEMPEDSIFQMTLLSASVAAATTAGINLRMSGKIFYQGLDKPIALEGQLTSGDTGIALLANTANVDTEILRFQTPKGSAWSFRKGDFIYLVLATA